MSNTQFILDLGSHSAKLYRNADSLKQVSVVTWELLENNPNEEILNVKFELLFSNHKCVKKDKIKAIGTAAMRRNPIIAKQVQDLCISKGIDFRVISQKEEALLIKKAITNASIPSHIDIINVGGGSIQLLLGEQRQEQLLDFGISDLNSMFHLTNAPGQRQIDECIEWIFNKLPETLRTFCYTGGECTYLNHFNVEIKDGYCSFDDFTLFSKKIASENMENLRGSSPYDSGWMNGAIASNCIVLAALKKANTKAFFPSDLNIAHGLLKLV